MVNGSLADFVANDTLGSPSTKTSADTTVIGPKVFIPEGSTVSVKKSEVQIEFYPIGSLPSETLVRSFRPQDNIASIKGFAVERLKNHYSSNLKVDFKQITVMRANDRLGNKKMLVDFIIPEYEKLVVIYPQVDTSLSLRKPSSESSEVEEDFRSIFE